VKNKRGNFLETQRIFYVIIKHVHSIPVKFVQYISPSLD